MEGEECERKSKAGWEIGRRNGNEGEGKDGKSLGEN